MQESERYREVQGKQVLWLELLGELREDTSVHDCHFIPLSTTHCSAKETERSQRGEGARPFQQGLLLRGGTPVKEGHLVLLPGRSPPETSHPDVLEHAGRQ